MNYANHEPPLFIPERSLPADFALIVDDELRRIREELERRIRDAKSGVAGPILG